LGVKAEFVLSSDEALAAVQKFVIGRNIGIDKLETAPPSPLGTLSYRARVNDGKGVIYCHSSGVLQGEVFYVRKGIGYLYEYVLKGSASPLGLPISNEEVVDGKGFPISYFESGFIEWSPSTCIGRAVVLTNEGEEVIAETRI
jgi:hypothetical protein